MPAPKGNKHNAKHVLPAPLRCLQPKITFSQEASLKIINAVMVATGQAVGSADAQQHIIGIMRKAAEQWAEGELAKAGVGEDTQI